MGVVASLASSSSSTGEEMSFRLETRLTRSYQLFALRSDHHQSKRTVECVEGRRKKKRIKFPLVFTFSLGRTDLSVLYCRIYF